MRGTSPILVTAALSIAGLIVAVGVHLGNSVTPKVAYNPADLEPVETRDYIALKDDNGNGVPDWQDELMTSGVAVSTTTDPTDEDPLQNMGDNVASALYGGYLSLKQAGTYSPSLANELGFSVAANIRADTVESPLTVNDITTRTNSPEATLAYRSDLRSALAPMLTDDTPELEYYAHYVTTKDASWLAKLQDAATRYRTARANMQAVAAPEDAVPEHLRALNALGAYAETLERLARFGNDTFAAIALLKTMNESEQEMLAAFDALAQYYVRTIVQ